MAKSTSRSHHPPAHDRSDEANEEERREAEHAPHEDEGVDRAFWDRSDPAAGTPEEIPEDRPLRPPGPPALRGAEVDTPDDEPLVLPRRPEPEDAREPLRPGRS
ncbi:MAG TPA: hypothetical protein VGF39_03960 [Stellaceae bacterium]|jgi:hypothetical protein